MKKEKSNANTSKFDAKLKVNGAGGGKKASKKTAKDPNKPKRPPSAFFVFMEEFRQEYKEKDPKNKSVAVVAKAGGDKWKTMSESEKAPYVAKAEKRKKEYNKNMEAYSKRMASGENADEESDKSKSEVNDEKEEEEDDE